MKSSSSPSLLPVAAFAVFSLTSFAQAAPEDIPLAKCPAPVQKALQAAGNVAHVVKDTQKDAVFYDADIETKGGSHLDLVVDSTGKEIKKSEDVKLAACPEVVKKVFLTKSIGKSIAAIEMITDDGGVSYLAHIKVKSAAPEKGKPEKAKPEKADPKDGDDKGGDEAMLEVEVTTEGKILATDEELTPQNTPEPIKKAIKEIAAGGKIEEVHKMTDSEAKTTYSAVITTTKNVVMDLEIDADGKVLEFKKAED